VATSANQLALGNGDGTFQAPVPILATLPPVVWVASGDVNNDGWTDLMFAGTADNPDLYLLLNNQQGSFTLTKMDDFSGAPTSVVLADLNADGNLDAVVVNAGVTANIYLGNGEGAFTTGQVNIAFPYGYEAQPQIGDVNGDGIPDLLLPVAGSIGIALGTGKGTFYPPIRSRGRSRSGSSSSSEPPPSVSHCRSARPCRTGQQRRSHGAAQPRKMSCARFGDACREPGGQCPFIACHL
jgi:hypothetical protein